MKANLRARKQIFEIVVNQMKNNDPPETRINYQRLRDMGYSDFETKQLIGQCIAVETYKILKYKQPFDRQRYIRHLNQLPKEPYDDQK
jgi:hypothetical protein